MICMLTDYNPAIMSKVMSKIGNGTYKNSD